MICMVEDGSEHPIGKSIALQLRTQITRGESDVSTPILLSFQALAGSGVIGSVINSAGIRYQIVIGSQSLLESHRIHLSKTQIALVQRLQLLGNTVILAGIDDELAVILSLADTIRPESKSVVKTLQAMGISVSMCTGDQEITAKVIAAKCGISEVYSSVSPAGKRNLVTKLQDGGKFAVGMVGDGINDAASIAQSDLGIAVYGGTDVAIEAASIVLMRSDLHGVVTSIHLCRAIHGRIWINFGWASVYNLLMIPMAMGAGVPWGITLPAMVSGMAMSLSSVSVVLSSLLLQRYQKPTMWGQDPQNLESKHDDLKQLLIDESAESSQVNSINFM